MSLVKDSSNEYVSSSAWDKVANCFIERKTEIYPYSPGNENYNIVWPVLCQVLEDTIGGNNYCEYNAFDYGCGTGILAEQLSQLGFNTFACDISREMIFYAKEYSKGNVDYECGGISVLQKRQQYFKLITAIMVFQFVFDIHSTIADLAKKLDKNGIIFFAVHSRDYIYECIEHSVKFRKIDDELDSNVAEILINDCWIKSYIRSPEWYDEIFQLEGLECIGCLQCETKPPFGAPKDIKWYSPKYYLAWYKKLGSD